MKFLAHIKTSESGNVSEQTAANHCTQTSKYSASALSAVSLYNTAALAGLLHDCGKFTDAFQNYISGASAQKRGSVIHTFQGCKYIIDTYHQSDDAYQILTAELISYAVGAHHGLFDCVDDERKIGLQYRAGKQNISYNESIENFSSEVADKSVIDRLFRASCSEIEEIVSRLDNSFNNDEEFCFSIGLLERLILSAVIEGDRRDTAEFMSNAVFKDWPENMSSVWLERLEYLENKLENFDNDSEINKARRYISDKCKNFAAKPSGIYRLNVPTGGGKTLSSLRFALAHAAVHNKKRIIFTSPLLSILEQNAKVIRDYLGDDFMILEHHSNIVNTDETKEALDERELLIQTWDSPVIITTLVQFLNTLFSGKTTSIRRFHSLSNSIIVIDEVQTVPTKLLSLFNTAIRFLSEVCGATLVLCSATQPYLEKAVHPLPFSLEDIVPQNKQISNVFKRTVITPINGCRQNEFFSLIENFMNETQSLLVVCNKKNEAAQLALKMKDADCHVFHLSAGMCTQHRRDVLEKLKESLERKDKTLCISTQVIEAGVDISFQRVIRFMAGMDSVVQSAGRCNRNGESSCIEPVFLVNCTDENLGRLQDIRRGKDATLSLLSAFKDDTERFGGDLASDEAIRYYYNRLYSEMSENAQDFPLSTPNTSIFNLLSTNTKYADMDCDGINNYQMYQAFKTAGQAFEVFDNGTTDVLVPYGEGKQIIDELCSSQAQYDIAYRSSLLKKASSYSVSVYDYQKKKLLACGALHEICGGSVLVLNEECYDNTIGLISEAKENEYWEV